MPVGDSIHEQGREATQPVDLAHLRRFTMGDRALEAEILALFANQLPVTIGALKNAPSAKEWGIAAHTLKGSARAVGAWSLATIAESISFRDGALSNRLAPPARPGSILIGRLLDAARFSWNRAATASRKSTAAQRMSPTGSAYSRQNSGDNGFGYGYRSRSASGIPGKKRPHAEAIEAQA